MSIFIFSLLAGLALHQLVSTIQPTKIASRYKPFRRIVKLGRRVVIEFEDGAFVAWKVGITTIVAVAFIIFAIVVNAQFVHPASGFPYRFVDGLTGPRMVAVVFGGLVGILLGNLLNRILRNEDDYKFTSSDRLELALIFALVLLGIGGEEVLRSYAQRINKISVGTTTEISFSDVTPKSSRISAEQPGGALQNTEETGTGGGSAGLGKLYDIGSEYDLPHIKRDWELIQVLARYEREEVPKEPPKMGRLSFDVLSPLASCLSRISRLYGDDAYVEQQLAPVALALRMLITNAPADHEQIRKLLADTAKEVGQYDKSRREGFKEVASQPKQVLEKRANCDRLTADGYDPVPALTDDSLKRFRQSHETFPYVAMSYASVMAALHRYEAAAITMDAWILHHYPPMTAGQKWYWLRAKITQAIFVDEWMRVRGAATSSPLRKYHIDNLKDIVDGMQSFSVITEIGRRNSGFKYWFSTFGASQSGDDGTCEVPELPKAVGNTVGGNAELKQDQVLDRLKVIYNTYLSAMKDHVDHSLKHPIEKVRWGSMIEDEIAKLMPLSLKCISYDTPGQLRTRAEHIERFVRSELNMLENTSSLKSQEEIGNKIRESKQLLTLASQLIDRQVEEAKKNLETGPIQNRIATIPVLEVYETLLATQAQLQNFSEREVAK